MTATASAPKTAWDPRWLTLGVTTIGSFLSLLNQTTANLGLPTILTTFNVDVQQGQWVITAYMIALAVIIPISGFLADKVGMKRLYLITMFLFVIGSLLCALAWDLPSLILFRVLQGLGGGMLQPLGMAIVYTMVTPLERPKFMPVLGLPMLAAPLLGPSVGGYLVEYVSWRGMFAVNIPIGLFGLAMAAWLLKETAARRGAKLDKAGFALSSIGFPALLLGFSFGSREGWTSLPVQLLLIGGAGSLIAWVIVELLADEPMLDLRLFASPIFSLGMAMQFMIQLSLFGMQLLLPLFLQTAQGLGALQAGLILMPQGIASFFSMNISGRLYNRLGPRFLVLIGLGMMTVTTWQLSHLSVNTSALTITVLASLRGLSMGFCFMPITTASYNTVPQAKIPRATALSNGMMRIFASFSTAFLSTLLGARSIFHYNQLASSITSDRPAVENLFNTLQPDLIARGITALEQQQRSVNSVIAASIRQESLIMAFNDTFMVITVVSVIAVGFAFFLRDPVLDAHNKATRDAAPPEPQAARTPATATRQPASAA